MAYPYGVYFDQMNETFRSDYKTLEVYLQIFSSQFCVHQIVLQTPILQPVVYFWYKVRR